MPPDNTPNRSNLVSWGNFFILLSLGALVYAAWYATQLPRSAAPAPVATQVPAAISTATSAPATVLSTPTPRPAETLSPDQDYTLATAMGISMYADAANTLEKQFAALGENAALVANPEWRESVDQALLEMDGFSALMRSITPPPDWSIAHAEFLLAADAVDRSVALFRQGFAESKLDSLQQAITEMAAVPERLDRAVASMPTATPAP